MKGVGRQRFFHQHSPKCVGSCWLHNILCGHGRVESGSHLNQARARQRLNIHITLQTPATENPPSHTGMVLNWAPQTCPFPLMNLQHRTPPLFYSFTLLFLLGARVRASLTSFLIYICIYTHSTYTPAEQAAGWQDIVIILKTNFVSRGRACTNFYYSATNKILTFYRFSAEEVC